MPEDPEKSGGEPNLELELPSLFRRGRKKKRKAEKPTTEAPAPTAPEEQLGFPAEDPVSDPSDGAARTAETPTRPGPTPVQGSTRRLPPTPPPVAPATPPAAAAESATEDTAPVGAGAAPADPDVEPIPAPTPAPTPNPDVEPIPAPTPVPTPTPVPDPDVEPIPAPAPVPGPTPLPDPTPEPTPGPAPVPVPTPGPEPTPFPPDPEPRPVSVEETSVLPGPASAVEDPDVPVGEPAAPPLYADEAPGRRRMARERTPITLPRINPRLAAVLSGLVVGLAGVLLSFGASQGCEAVRGVGSCGGTGLFALLAVVVIQVLLGSLLLRAFGLTDPTSTSFLGVGLVAVLALLFFLGSLESVWMLLVIPVLTAITFLVSWWVTETFIEEGADDNLHR